MKSATDNIGTFDPGNPDIRYSRACARSQNGNAMPSADEQRRMEKFAAAVGGLTAGRKDGTLAAVDQKRLTAVMRGLGSGELKHPRFTKEEAAASEGTEHERLWNFILSLESSEVHAGGGAGVDGSEGGEHSQGGGWLGQLRRMATRYGSDPQEVKASEHKYLDKGAESTVYATSGKTVVKVRKLSAYSLDGVKEALAKIVYHNYLFPKDAYTLQDIAVWDDNGYDRFYLILEQPLVTPKTDAAGNIIAPSEGQIFEALNKTKQRFRIYDEAWDRQGADERTNGGEAAGEERRRWEESPVDERIPEVRRGLSPYVPTVLTPSDTALTPLSWAMVEDTRLTFPSAMCYTLPVMSSPRSAHLVERAQIGTERR